MSSARQRNPERTREFYENMMAEQEAHPIMSPPNGNLTATGAGSAAKGITIATDSPVDGLTTPIPISVSVANATTTTAKATTPTTTQPPLIGMFNNVWDGVRGIFGGKKPNCLNGGKNKIDGSCECPKYYNGTSCEKKQCLNGGTLHKVTSGQISYECQCAHSLYMEGSHCERIRCANDAILVTAPNGSWSCDCSQRLFYKGVFCEKFSPPMGIAIPLAVALVFLICCGLCRIDWCPRKRTNRRREERSGRTQSSNQGRRRATPRSVERGRVAQPIRATAAHDLLLPGDRALCARNPVAFPAHGNPYIVRLDTIPTFNPNMIGGVDPSAVGSSSMKPIEPPPPYEQALQAPLMLDPPRYSERVEPPLPLLQTSQQPPPPSIRPPTPPSS